MIDLPRAGRMPAGEREPIFSKIDDRADRLEVVAAGRVGGLLGADRDFFAPLAARL